MDCLQHKLAELPPCLRPELRLTDMYHAGTMPFVRLPSKIDARLAREDKRRKLTKSKLAHAALAGFPHDLDDVRDAARQRRAIQAGRLKTIPLKTVMRQHGMAS